MTSYERVSNTLARQPVDHIATVINPWDATVARWCNEGHIARDEDVFEHFQQDLRIEGWITATANLDQAPVVLEETDETILTLDGNGYGAAVQVIWGADLLLW
jgi:hypothetical protein